jgi:hypothetical protein
MKIKIRIAIAVSSTGEWRASGDSGWNDREALIDSRDMLSGLVENQFFIESEIDVPEVQTLKIDAAKVD